MHALTALFGEKDQLSLGQECARAVVIFVYGLALVRIAGRRIFGKWAALDIVVSIIIGSNLSRALTGSAPFPETLAATTVLVALHWILAHLSARSPLVSRIVEGEPVVLAEAGRLFHNERIWESVSPADLQEGLRQSGLERPEDARRVTLEPSGKITVLKKES